MTTRNSPVCSGTAPLRQAAMNSTSLPISSASWLSSVIECRLSNSQLSPSFFHVLSVTAS